MRLLDSKIIEEWGEMPSSQSSKKSSSSAEEMSFFASGGFIQLGAY